MKQVEEQEGNNDDNISNKEKELEELRSSPKDRELQRGDSQMSIDNEIVSIYLFN